MELKCQHQLEAVRDIIDPDVMGIQETKVHDEQFPLENVESLGYHVEYFGQKAHYGVAKFQLTIFDKTPGEAEGNKALCSCPLVCLMTKKLKL